MSINFTRYAFTDAVRKVQERYGTRKAYARVERSLDQYRLTAREVSFIEARDSFYLATVGENGWPYVQFRGGEKGFLRLIDDNTIGYADFRGNGQYISTGNIEGNEKAALILMDYPNRQRLKIWAEASITRAGDDTGLLARLEVAGYKGEIERLVMLKVLAFDWNCPRHITPRYTLDEIRTLTGDPVQKAR
ncbi:MAG: pyridoxamine 5'-phosphate oxidase family protein [Gammaproteobacteria bacterium]|jgi:predicted pyridoxine 5'-phosphate oxidase superfamily flavin-nucleotide-binding protein